MIDQESQNHEPFGRHPYRKVVGECLSRASGSEDGSLQAETTSLTSKDLPKKGRKPYLGKEVLVWTWKPCFRSLSLRFTVTVIEFTGKIVSSLNAAWHAKPREDFRKETDIFRILP